MRQRYGKFSAKGSRTEAAHAGSGASRQILSQGAPPRGEALSRAGALNKSPPRAGPSKRGCGLCTRRLTPQRRDSKLSRDGQYSHGRGKVRTYEKSGLARSTERPSRAASPAQWKDTPDPGGAAEDGLLPVGDGARAFSGPLRQSVPLGCRNRVGLPGRPAPIRREERRTESARPPDRPYGSLLAYLADPLLALPGSSAYDPGQSELYAKARPR